MAMAVKERDAEPILAVMIPRQGHSEEPPACIAEAMKKAEKTKDEPPPLRPFDLD